MRWTDSTQSRATARRLALLLALWAVGSIFLYCVGDAALTGTANFQFFADSGTYMRLANGALGEVDSLRTLVGFSMNFLGPLAILRLAGENVYLVLLINIALYGIATTFLIRATQADEWTLHLLLLANPITLSSLLSVNKEIISLLCVSLVVFGLMCRSWKALALSVIVGLLTRWQFAVFCLLVIILFSPLNRLQRRRWLTVLCLLALASLAIWLLNPVVSKVRSFHLDTQGYQGSGLFESLVNAQTRGLYWAVFVPKALHLMFGLGLRLDRLFDPTNLYNDVWQLLHSTAMLAVTGMLVLRRRLLLRYDLVFIGMLYLLVFVLTPIYVPRYLYPVYVLLAMMFSTAEPTVFGKQLEARDAPQIPPSTPKK